MSLLITHDISSMFWTNILSNILAYPLPLTTHISSILFSKYSFKYSCILLAMWLYIFSHTIQNTSFSFYMASRIHLYVLLSSFPPTTSNFFPKHIIATIMTTTQTTATTTLPISNIINFLTNTLNETNYLVWRNQMQSILLTCCDILVFMPSY